MYAHGFWDTASAHVCVLSGYFVAQINMNEDVLAFAYSTPLKLYIMQQAINILQEAMLL